MAAPMVYDGMGDDITVVFYMCVWALICDLEPGSEC